MATATAKTSTVEETQTVSTSPLLNSIAKTDREILASRASRAVNGIQRQLSTKWNQVNTEFLQLEDEYQTLTDLSPKTSVDLGVEVKDVNLLVDQLSKVVEKKYNLYNFRLKPLHDLMSQCFGEAEMAKYELPSL